MPAIPREMREHLDAVPEGLWSLFLPQLLQLGAQTFSVPCGIGCRLDGTLAAGWYWGLSLDCDCLITTLHLVARRTFVLREEPEVDYLVLGLLSSSDTGLINDMREPYEPGRSPSDPFSDGFSPTLTRNALAFPMEHGLREFEMPAGSLHDSCSICMLPSFVERMQESLGPNAPDLASAIAAGIELNGSERIRTLLRSLDPTDATRAGAALHYRALVYELLAELASHLQETAEDSHPLDLSDRHHVSDAVSAALLASLADPPSLDELSESLFMGKTHLCQAFRAETGMSIGERLTELRVNEAQRRLAYGQQSVAEIARSLGFRHTSSFSAMFARQTGMSPTAWREAQGQS